MNKGDADPANGTAPTSHLDLVLLIGGLELPLGPLGADVEWFGSSLTRARREVVEAMRPLWDEVSSSESGAFDGALSYYAERLAVLAELISHINMLQKYGR